MLNLKSTDGVILMIIIGVFVEQIFIKDMTITA